MFKFDKLQTLIKPQYTIKTEQVLFSYKTLQSIFFRC